MAGGLVQLAVHGSQDIFLTGSPQITFFKIVYRRHTNFATESIRQDFIGLTNFDHEMTAILDKNGDLMSKVYLEIDLPKVDLIKNPDMWILNKIEAKNLYDETKDLYQRVCSYIAANTDITRQLHILLKTNNICMNDIIKTMNDEIFGLKLCKSREHLKKTQIENFSHIDILLIFNSYIKYYKEDARSKLLEYISNIFYKELQEFYSRIYDEYIQKEITYQKFLDKTYVERYKFAWVEEIGHAIIDYIEFRIGGNLIDKHRGDWLMHFSKIFVKSLHKENYDRMIGNVDKLTIFNDEVKNVYRLVIPFQFSFCRHTGLALPVVALRYHDVIFNVKLRDLSKVCYVEDCCKMSMANLQSHYNLNILDAKLYIEYIFLDTEERQRFVQSSHEYLIETVQQDDFEVSGNSCNIHPSFSNSTKFVMWYAQPAHFRDNPDGHTKCRWNELSIGSSHPMESSHLRLNSYDLSEKSKDLSFASNVTPYMHFNHSGVSGLNIYSFGLKPLEHQPTGTINFSRIDDFSIEMNFKDDFVKEMDSRDIYVACYAQSYNILRIMSGMGALAFLPCT